MMKFFRLVLNLALLSGTAVFAQAPKPAARPTPPPAPTKSPQEAFKDAQQFYSDGDWPKALEAFQNFEKTYPFSQAVPSAIFFQGWCWANQSRHQEAVNVFQRLITSSYSNTEVVAEAVLKQAECYREMNESPKAIELYRKFQKEYPQHELTPQASLGEAWAVFKGGNPGSAKTIIRVVQSRYADNPGVQLDALFLLGQVLTEEKDFQAANKVYREITRQRSNPRATEALYLAAEAMFSRGETLGRDGKQEEANKAFRDAINYYKGVRSKAALLEVLGRDLASLNAARGSLGLDAWTRRSEAVKRLMAQIKDRPDLRVLALFRVANCYQALEMPEEACVVYQYLLERYPDDRAAEQINFGYIQTLTQRGQMEKANVETEKFKTKYPKSIMLNNASLIQAEALFGQKRYKEALVEYDKSLAATKEAGTIETIEFRVATCYFNLEEFEKARDAFNAFAQKHAGSNFRADALFFLGLTHYEIANRSNDPKIAQPNLEAGLKAYEEIRSKHAGYEKISTVSFRLGYLFSFLGAYDKANYDKAITTFDEFIKKWPTAPEVPEAWYQLARNNAAVERFDAAIAAYKVLFEKYPDHDLAPYAALEIGTTYASMKKMAEMVEAFRAFVQKYPDHAKVGDVMYAIATELKTQKRFDEAILSYRQIIDRALAAPSLTDDVRNIAISSILDITGILEQRNDPKTVVGDLEQFLQKFSSDPIAARTLVAQLARVYLKNRLNADGTTKLEALSQQYAANAAIRHACVISLIEVSLADKDLTRANGLVVRLLNDPEKDKLPASGLLSIGNVSLKTEKYAQAKDGYERALAAATNQRDKTFANVGLGQALVALKDFNAALPALEAALGDPQNTLVPETKLALGKVKEAGGKLEDAVKFYSDCLPAKGDVGFEAAHHLGNIFFNMVSPDAVKDKDNKKTALAYYARLLFAPAGPMADEAAYRTSECHQLLGNTDLACSTLQSYLKRFPTGKYVEQGKAKLPKLCAPKPQ